MAVTYYLRYNLIYRDISEILLERGVTLHHTTIYRWVQQYSKILYSEWKRENILFLIHVEWMKPISKSKGSGDIYTELSIRMALLWIFFKNYGSPRAIVTDHAPATKCALEILKRKGFYKVTKHRTN